MTAREWKPGDVAMVRLDPETEIRVMYNGANWVGRKGAFYDLHASARPLVVIDPESEDDVKRLLRLLQGMSFAAHACGAHACLVVALREFANPKPKPEEPTGLGAVVEDADGKRWVRVLKAPAFAPWAPEGQIGLHPSWGTYADIDAVRVLSEGVTA